MFERAKSHVPLGRPDVGHLSPAPGQTWATSRTGASAPVPSLTSAPAQPSHGHVPCAKEARDLATGGRTARGRFTSLRP
eukprot:515065-Rhodomonas_salina.1